MKHSAFTKSFPEPLTQHEADQRLKELNQRIDVIEHDLKRSRHDTTILTSQWRLRAEAALKIKRAQRELLVQWATERAKTSPDLKQRRAIEVLAEVRDLVKSLELSELTEKEAELIEEMERIVAEFRKHQSKEAGNG